MKNKDVKRVFIGIPVGNQIKPILPLLKSTINCNPSIIKWLPIKNIHLTLSFVGEISNNDIPEFIQLVKYNIEIAQFQLTISRTGVFPASKLPKVLWLDLDQGIDGLKLLHYQIGRFVGKFKNNYENNKFIPHITIARIRSLYAKIDVLPFLNSVYSTIELDVNSISMYESNLTPEGAHYTIINTFPLTD